MIANGLKKCLHKKEKGRSRQNNPPEGSEKFPVYLSEKTQWDYNKHEQDLRRPIPGTEEGDQNQAENQGQLGEWIETMEEAVLF